MFTWVFVTLGFLQLAEFARVPMQAFADWQAIADVTLSLVLTQAWLANLVLAEFACVPMCAFADWQAIADVALSIVLTQARFANLVLTPSSCEVVQA